jgi:hypothetical protein
MNPDRRKPLGVLGFLRPTFGSPKKKRKPAPPDFLTLSQSVSKMLGCRKDC